MSIHNMILRSHKNNLNNYPLISKTCKPQFHNHFDFIDSSNLWNSNKIKHPNCTYSYKCIATTHTNKQCKNKCLPSSNYCYCHRNYINHLQ